MLLRCFWFIAGSVLAFTGLSAHSKPVLPEGLSAQDWVQIEQQIQAQRFAVQPSEDFDQGWQSSNPAHGFGVVYQPDGQTVLTMPGANHGSDHQIALRLEGYGYGDDLIGIDTAPSLSANGNTVTYQWKPGLREWWINNEQGVAQWFELAERPAVAASGQPLVVAMQLDTDLDAVVTNNILKLSSAVSGTTIVYHRLKVWDATGQTLPAQMRLKGNQLALLVDESNAVYPITIDPTFAQIDFLKASNAGGIDRFGQAIAISGNTLVVGASGEASTVPGGPGDNSSTRAGAAYVFVRDGGGNWSQQAFLKAPNAEAEDRFGSSVDISGDTIVVAAVLEDSSASGGPSDNSAEDAGAVYVFVRSRTNWTQQAYLKASNAEANDLFGFSTSLSGNTLVVGASDEDSSAGGGQANNSELSAGAVYVFERSGSSWTQQAFLKASNAEAGDGFGSAVALSGDQIVVGAWQEDSSATGGPLDNSSSAAGAAYVFQRSGSSWTEQAYLKASNADASDRFGRELAFSEGTIVVTSLQEDSAGPPSNNSFSLAGAAYVFEQDDSGSWDQRAYLKASNAGAGDLFGRSVAIQGDLIAIGAWGEDSSATGGETDNSEESAGAAYLFVRTGSDWSQLAYLKASNAEEDDNFGAAVALSEEALVVGAFREDSSADGGEADNSMGEAGAAYVFDIPRFTIGGSVMGLSGSGLELQNNSGDDLPITMNGSFTFPTALVDGSNFAVTVASDPTGPSQTCTVSNGAGTVASSNVTNVEVTCITDQFTIGGTVSGLLGDQVVLQNNGVNQVITANGSFTIATQDDGTSYAVTVATQPSDPSQTCAVTNGSGTISGADVTDIEVTCSTNQFTLGGSVSGLNGTGLVLQNNGTDNLPITADGPFTFPTALDDGSAYNITVFTQPSTARDQECTVVNGMDTLSGSDVSDVSIQCADITVELSTNELDIGTVFIGANETGTITVTNTGTPDVLLNGITFPFPPFQIVGGSCLMIPVTLAAGESCTIDVRFTPTEFGEFSSEVIVLSNAVSSPDTVVVRGRGLFEPMVVPTLNVWGLLVLMMLLMAALRFRSKTAN